MDIIRMTNQACGEELLQKHIDLKKASKEKPISAMRLRPAAFAVAALTMRNILLIARLKANAAGVICVRRVLRIIAVIMVRFTKSRITASGKSWRPCTGKKRRLQSANA